MNDGQKVTTAEMWWDQRRPELVEMFSKYVYGRVPNNVPKVTWTVTTVDHEMIGFTPVIAKDLIGEVDNSSFPAIKVRIHMTLVTPANAKGPCAGADDVRPRRIPRSQRAFQRRVRSHQRCMESNTRAAGSLTQRSFRSAPRMAAREGYTVQFSRS